MWWRRQASRATRARLYLKPDCGLCEQAVAVLRSFEGVQLIVDRIDIAEDPELLRRYFLTIPVLELETGARLEWPFDRADIKRLLAASC